MPKTTATTTETELLTNINPATNDDWGADDGDYGFDDEMETSLQLPSVQIIKKPNLKTMELEQGNHPFGLFINKENAALAGFVPNEHWQEHKQIFGEKDLVEGYLATTIRMCIVLQSASEVQHTDDDPSTPGAKWSYVGLGWQNRKKTEFGELASDENNKQYRFMNRYLIAFLNDDNSLMHTSSPFAMRAIGAWSAGISTESKDLYSAMDGVYKAQREAEGAKLSGNKLPAHAHSLTILDMQLGWHRRSGLSPSTVIKMIKIPSIAQAPDKEIDRGNKSKGDTRIVIQKAVPLGKLLLKKSHPTGQQLLEWRETYATFALPNAGYSDDVVESSEPVSVKGKVSDLNFKDDGSLHASLVEEGTSMRHPLSFPSTVAEAFMAKCGGHEIILINGVQQGSSLIVKSFEVISEPSDDEFGEEF